MCKNVETIIFFSFKNYILIIYKEYSSLILFRIFDKNIRINFYFNFEFLFFKCKEEWDFFTSLISNF